MPPTLFHDALIAEATIFTRGLFVMTFLRHGLPVVSIPEQCHVTFVRHDVINDFGLAQSQRAFLAVWTLAQRMRPQESFACLLPFVPIAALS